MPIICNGRCGAIGKLSAKRFVTESAVEACDEYFVLQSETLVEEDDITDGTLLGDAMLFHACFNF